ncbi:unnamed protein product [marine sediment metagenome]|uniref:Uncharacterized protein n=1 Tax=marine sediment metagenome TaxID=412755 RepID=X1TBD6_9ZZZZ
MEENPHWKCINPGCRHEWASRGWRPKNLRCPKCHSSYVLEKAVFNEAVAEDRKVLDYADANADTKVMVRYEVYVNALGNVVRKLFPMLPFSPFQVIYEEALKERQNLN